MNELEKFTEGMVKEEVERLITEIEEHIKGLIFAPAQNFPITQTFNIDDDKYTVTYHEPDNEGNIPIDVTREFKVIEIEVKFDES